ncbi:hypothetical protein BV25DRAFT_1919586 [Artomyces pyxidatus]|uniref:Uncharacterized protein n=1 Tax=Artomyces pyxidatus TaxID=48021 RepID=A0ACB8SQ17_9AGAM|nr:hypothetical protein BV25DRAFT_1919586 [Artomyces pyxidatus]
MLSQHYPVITFELDEPRSFTRGRTPNKDMQERARIRMEVQRWQTATYQLADGRWATSGFSKIVPLHPDAPELPEIPGPMSDGRLAQLERGWFPQNFDATRPWLPYAWLGGENDPARATVIYSTIKWDDRTGIIGANSTFVQTICDEQKKWFDIAKAAEKQLMDKNFLIPADMTIDEETFYEFRWNRSTLHEKRIICADIQRSIIDLRAYALWVSYTLAYSAGYITEQEPLLPIVGCWVREDDRLTWNRLCYGGVPCWKILSNKPRDPGCVVVAPAPFPEGLSQEIWDEEKHHPRPESTYGKKERKERQREREVTERQEKTGPSAKSDMERAMHDWDDELSDDDNYIPEHRQSSPRTGTDTRVTLPTESSKSTRRRNTPTPESDHRRSSPTHRYPLHRDSPSPRRHFSPTRSRSYYHSPTPRRYSYHSPSRDRRRESHWSPPRYYRREFRHSRSPEDRGRPLARRSKSEKSARRRESSGTPRPSGHRYARSSSSGIRDPVRRPSRSPPQKQQRRRSPSPPAPVKLIQPLAERIQVDDPIADSRHSGARTPLAHRITGSTPEATPAIAVEQRIPLADRITESSPDVDQLETSSQQDSEDRHFIPLDDRMSSSPTHHTAPETGQTQPSHLSLLERISPGTPPPYKIMADGRPLSVDDTALVINFTEWTVPHIVVDSFGHQIETRLPLCSAQVDAFLQTDWLDDDNGVFLISMASWENQAPQAAFTGHPLQFAMPPPAVLENWKAVYQWSSIRSEVLHTIRFQSLDKWATGATTYWRNRLRPKGILNQVLQRFDSPEQISQSDLTGITDLSGKALRKLLPEDFAALRWEANTFLFHKDFERLVFAKHPSQPLLPDHLYVLRHLRMRVRRLWGPTDFIPRADDHRFVESPDDLMRMRFWRAIGCILAEVEGTNKGAIELAMGGSVTGMVEVLTSEFTNNYRTLFNRDPMTPIL